MRTLGNILYAHFSPQCVVMGCCCLSEFPHLELLPFLVLPQGQEDLDRLFKPLKFDYRHPDFIVKVVSYLPKALKKKKYDFISAFLAVYPVFASTREVLELLTDVIL